MKKNLFVFGLTIFSLVVVGCDNKKPAHKHTFSDEYESDVTYHWHPSTCGHDVVDGKAEHTPGTPVRENESDATCETAGGYDDVTYCTVCARELSRDHHTISALGHDWSEVTYSWSDDNKCTASRYCLTDNSHTESETVNGEITTQIAANCTEKGSETYTATFVNTAFVTQTKTIEVESTGHNMSEPTYEWNTYNQCTASRHCLNDNCSHTESETVSGVLTSELPAVCEEKGHKTYTATFTNEAFETQTKTIELDELGHDWSSIQYIWNFTVTPAVCTARRYCFNNDNHVESETVEGVLTTVTVAPGCTTKGRGVYVATFTNPLFVEQSMTEDVAPIGHDWDDPVYVWNENHTKCNAIKYCKHDHSHKNEFEINSKYEVIVEPTVESEGLGRYTAYWGVSGYETQTYDVVLEKLKPEHHYGGDPVLSDDGKTITYGLYPQTLLENTDNIYATLESDATLLDNGFYEYNDEFYAKTTGTTVSNAKANHTFETEHRIVSGNTYWFKCEPIVWNVLSNTGDSYYVVSSVLLDSHNYFYTSEGTRMINMKTIYPNNYMYSDLRSWLNESFYNSAFDQSDDYVQTTTVSNYASTTDNTKNSYACNPTEDKIYLPSYQDYKNSSYGFSDDAARTCLTTDWTRARGGMAYNVTEYFNNGYYWTRSPYSSDSTYVNFVMVNGSIFGYGGVTTTLYCIRPAMTIKLA